MIINALVEGVVDEAVAQRIILRSGHDFGVCYGKRGIDYIRLRIGGFNNAAIYQHLLVLVDQMDTGFECPPDVVSHWVPHRNPNLLFRVVVPEVESWLLADRAGLADFLHVSLGRIPSTPEAVEDPKSCLIGAARRSRSSRVRDALVPPIGATSAVGRLYTSEIVSFIRHHWNLDRACRASPSLAACMGRLRGSLSTPE